MLQVHSFRDLLSEASRAFGDRPFLAGDDLLGSVSYSEVLQFARGFERSLDELQIPEGAAVATIFHNCGLAVLTFLATMASRRVFVPLNPISTQSEAEYMLERANCRVVILDPTHAKATDFGTRETVRIRDHARYFRERKAQGGEASADGVPGSDSFVGEVVYTSGSTGRPKGVLLSERSLLANASSLAQAYELDSTDRLLTVCPLFHNSGQVFTTLGCALVGGSTVAIKSDIGMLNFWHYVGKHRAHWSLGMVSFLALLLARKDGPPQGTQMRGLLTGGSAIDAGLVQAFESRFGVPVRTIYGLTESSSIATCEWRDADPRSLGSSGKPLPSSDVRIAREPGELVPASDPRSRERGEIWIGGPTVFDSYVGDPALTQVRKHDGWLQTGDLGYFDDNGNLFVVDRLDSMLIVGGENVYPAEVERLSTQLQGAVQVVLAGVDHPIWGKELVLVYKCEGGAPAPLAAWHRTLTEHIAVFKMPQRYVAISELGMDDFPRKSNGKLDRQAIAMALQRLGPTQPAARAADGDRSVDATGAADARSADRAQFADVIRSADATRTTDATRSTDATRTADATRSADAAREVRS